MVRWLPKTKEARLATLLAFIFAAATFTFSAMRCVNFHCSMIDLGSFYQVTNALYQGELPVTKLQPPYIAKHWLAIHFSPIIFLISPLYWLWSSPLLLQLVQSALVASVAIPIYLSSKALGLNARAALMITLVFFINPFVISGTIWDFHEVAFAVPLFGWLMFSIITKRFGLFLLCCLGLLCTKEHYGLAVAGAGLLWAVHHKEKIKGFDVLLLGLMALVVTITTIMPYFAEGGVAAALDTSGVGEKRYGWLTASLSDPSLFLTTLLNIFPQWLIYAVALLLPFLFLPVLAILWLLPLAADLTTNLLSSVGLPRSFIGYHTMPMIPVLVIVLAKVLAERNLQSIKIILLMPLVFFGYYLGHPHGAGYWQAHHVSFDLAEQDKQFVERISRYVSERSNNSVAMQNNLGVLLDIPAERLSYFPHPSLKSDIIVARVSYPFDDYKDVIGTAYNMDPETYFDTLEKYVVSGRYNITMYERGWLLLSNRQVTKARQEHQANYLLEKILVDIEKQKEKIKEIYSKPPPSRLFF